MNALSMLFILFLIALRNPVKSHPAFSSNTIDVSNRILRSVESELQSSGYSTRRTYLSYHFAGVHAVRLVDGEWDGGADPGRDGMAIAV